MNESMLNRHRHIKIPTCFVPLLLIIDSSSSEPEVCSTVDRTGIGCVSASGHGPMTKHIFHNFPYFMMFTLVLFMPLFKIFLSLLFRSLSLRLCGVSVKSVLATVKIGRAESRSSFGGQAVLSLRVTPA